MYISPLPCGVALSPSLQKAQHLAQLGVPLAERVLLPHILEITKSLYAGLAWGGTGREVRTAPSPSFSRSSLTPLLCLIALVGSSRECMSHQPPLCSSSMPSGAPPPTRPMQTCMRLLRSLFYNMALGKFLDVQAAFGASGLHAKLVDASLELLRGPAATPAQVGVVLVAAVYSYFGVSCSWYLGL